MNESVLIVGAGSGLSASMINISKSSSIFSEDFGISETSEI